MTVPLDDPEDLTLDVLALATTELRIPFLVAEVQGTGFLLGDGLLVTCWHCIGDEPAQGTFYSATRPHQSASVNSSPIGFREHLGKDLAWARVNWRARLGFRISEKPAVMGDEVWTFGYPLTDKTRLPDGQLVFTAHPRLLQGHITRAFRFPHHKHGNIASYELSFATPPGLRGSPLFRRGTLEVVGVVYGNNDVHSVLDQASVDPETGERQPEIQRVVSFGLAHHWSLLKSVADKVGTFGDSQFID